MNHYKVASFFSGAGGLDLGLTSSGSFELPWANEIDKRVHATFERNFPHTLLDKRSIELVEEPDIPDEIHGFVGGPPCQSWSEAGARRGIEDPRGVLFNNYIALLDKKKPAFFLAENVTGILFERNRSALDDFLKGFADSGYHVAFGVLNAGSFSVPQDRERVIIVGYRTDLGISFDPPSPHPREVTIEEALKGLAPGAAIPIGSGSQLLPTAPLTNNHYLDSNHYSYIYMSRNRRRDWSERSFTIQATGSHVPIHPSSPPMQKLEKDRWVFGDSGPLTRRFSIRECARIQTFPDSHEFVYENLLNGYRMVGNAVPVEFARALAVQIASQLDTVDREKLMIAKGRNIAPGGITRF
jgi:DNA (cytosine-5)-methyltransferase 1